MPFHTQSRYLIPAVLSDFGDAHGAHSTNLVPASQLRVLAEFRVRFAANALDQAPPCASGDLVQNANTGCLNPIVRPAGDFTA
jgi:hypothetical protein